MVNMENCSFEIKTALSKSKSSFLLADQIAFKYYEKADVVGSAWEHLHWRQCALRLLSAHSIQCGHSIAIVNDIRHFGLR
jgi:hypothetical protein